jgi:hypothetical protein
MTSSFDSVCKTVGETLRGLAHLVDPDGSSLPAWSLRSDHDTTYPSPNIPPEMTLEHRRWLFDDKGRPHGPDYIREQVVRTAKETWAKHQADFTIDVSEFTVFAIQLTGEEDLGVKYIPDRWQKWSQQESNALHTAEVIADLGYCPTRAVAIRQTREDSPLWRYWRTMEKDAIEAANQAIEASKASTEVGSASGNSKGKKLFKD